MIPSAIGTTIVALAALWLLGGFLARLGGALIALAGVLGLATTGNADALVVTAIGTLLWLAGHWHYALRHHEYKSPLARHLFCRLAPGRLDPSRGWAVAVAPRVLPGGGRTRDDDEPGAGVR